MTSSMSTTPWRATLAMQSSAAYTLSWMMGQNCRQVLQSGAHSLLKVGAPLALAAKQSAAL